MANNIVREITPLTQSDCFTIFSRTKKEFDFPLHYHEEYELNLILYAEGNGRLRLTYQQPWEPEAQPAQSFDCSINVN